MHARGPTYPMIPHILASLRSAGRASWPVALCRAFTGSRPPAGRDWRCYHRALGLLRALRLGEDADERLGAGRAHEHPAAPVELGVQPLDLRCDAGRHLEALDADVLLRLREARHHGGCLGERAALERPAERQRGCKAVAGHVSVEDDQVPRLLSAEHAALAPKRLENVAGRRRRSSRRGFRGRPSAGGSRGLSCRSPRRGRRPARARRWR